MALVASTVNPVASLGGRLVAVSEGRGGSRAEMSEGREAAGIQVSADSGAGRFLSMVEATARRNAGLASASADGAMA